MAYTLAGTAIRRPNAIDEQNSTQYAQVRTLGGNYNRDYFGSNKRVWTLTYNNLNTTDFTTLKTIYTNYLSNGNPVTWVSTEANYAISSTNVHVDIQDRKFQMPGSTYISDITVILTEA